MPDITYSLALPAEHPEIKSGVLEFRVQFREGSRTRGGVTGSEFSVPVGGSVTTSDVAAQAILDSRTDDRGDPVFVRDAVADRGTELDTEVFDRFRTQRVR